MIKTKIILIFIGIVALSSCSKDDAAPGEQPQKDTDHLIGKWELIKIGEKLEVDGEIFSGNINDPVTPDYTQQITFNTDNTLNFYAYFPPTDTHEEQTYRYDFEYERTGNQIVVKIGPDEIHTIVVLDEHNLHLESINEWDDKTGKHYKVTYVEQYVK